jgi:hypothetical protein
MRVVLFLFLIIFITSCDSPYPIDNSHLPNKQTLANEVRNQTFAQLKKEKELYPFGTGSGMMDQIRMLALSFRYYKEIDIEEARELLMAVGTLFLKNINGNDRIRPYLTNYPFRPENIDIAIFLQKPNGSEPDLDKLTIIEMTDGILKYSIRSSETGRLTRICKETFVEAAAKLGIGGVGL